MTRMICKLLLAFFSLVASSYATSQNVAVVRHYYELLAGGQCEAALKLRPGAEKNLCKINSIEELDVSAREERERAAIVKLRVKYTTTLNEIVDFDGFVVLNIGTDQKLKILHDGFYSSFEDALDRLTALGQPNVGA